MTQSKSIKINQNQSFCKFRKAELKPCRELYVSERVAAFALGNPYPLAYMVVNSTVKLILQKHWTPTVEHIKNTLPLAYRSLLVGACNQTVDLADASDVLQQAVQFLYEHGRWETVRTELRRWCASEKNTWIESDIAYYDDDGVTRRVPAALTCAIDGSGRSCTVSSWTLEEVAAVLNQIPLSTLERKVLESDLAGAKQATTARRLRLSESTVHTALQRARAKAYIALKK